MVQKEYTVSLKSINDVKKFCEVVSTLAYEVELKSGKYIVDAKSIIGVFSLDLSQPLVCVVNLPPSPDEITDFLEVLKDFIV
ncbi:hypothetical protein FACS189499_03310 [Clostridia bacterium]|nr:hypothetical protein FACS189499_03310 [Clostridia bacterium]